LLFYIESSFRVLLLLVALDAFGSTSTVLSFSDSGSAFITFGCCHLAAAFHSLVGLGRSFLFDLGSVSLSALGGDLVAGFLFIATLIQTGAFFAV